MSLEIPLSWVDFIPVVGHVKALIHTYNETHDLAATAFKRATHSTAVICFGVLGGHLGDPEENIPLSAAGCIVCGCAGGVFVDKLITLKSSEPYGYFSYTKWYQFLGLAVVDGVIGMVAFVAFTMVTSMLKDTGSKEEIECGFNDCEELQILKDTDYRDLVNVPKSLVVHIPQLQETPVDNISQLQPGDHILYKRGICWKFNAYDHHAIVGDVFPEKGIYTVYEQASFNDKDEYFFRGKAWIKEIKKSFEPKLIFKVDHGEIAKPGDDVRKTAHYICHHATANDFIKKYNFVRNNCEHFANFCATNRRESHQVQNGMAVIFKLSLTIAGFILSTSRKMVEFVFHSNPVLFIRLGQNNQN